MIIYKFTLAIYPENKFGWGDIEQRDWPEETFNNFKWDRVNCLHFPDQSSNVYLHINKDYLNGFRDGLSEMYLFDKTEEKLKVMVPQAYAEMKKNEALIEMDNPL